LGSGNTGQPEANGKTDADGVSWDAMIMGKLEFIDKYKLPIHVKYQTPARPEDQPVIPSPDLPMDILQRMKRILQPVFRISIG
jgi:hypothetical protein